MFTENRKKQLVAEARRRLPEAIGLTGIVSGYYCNELRDRDPAGVWLTVEISFYDGDAFATAGSITAYFPDDSRYRCQFRGAA